MRRQRAVVPEDAGESRVPHNVVVGVRPACLKYIDHESLTVHSLTHMRLEEVVAAYNAWRRGNLAYCTVLGRDSVKQQESTHDHIHL